jgi:hypothetical protein
LISLWIILLMDYTFKKNHTYPFVNTARKSCTDMLTRQVCMSDVAVSETSLTNIVDVTRILTKVMIGLAD